MNKFIRAPKERYYRRLFYVAFEGKVTEKEYFNRLQKFAISNNGLIKPIPPQENNSPAGTLQRLTDVIRTKRLSSGDEIWCVIDKDRWPQSQLDEVLLWARSSIGKIVRGVALSNPKFELWLLAHFEELNLSNTSAGAVVKSLKKYLPDYDKSLGDWKPTKEEIVHAVERCKVFSENPPLNSAGSSVWELVQRIIM